MQPFNIYSVLRTSWGHIVIILCYVGLPLQHNCLLYIRYYFKEMAQIKVCQINFHERAMFRYHNSHDVLFCCILFVGRQGMILETFC